ncbi:MAG TPA: glyoxylate/hydroxypyruvate reductase A [Rhizomicrobium sp.]|nr:glyoxylate/hydroxypyruvate reductase A [Rhizomicrobium sp.]
MSTRPNLLLIVPPGWGKYWHEPLAAANVRVFLYGQDAFSPGDIDYALGFRPKPGFLKTLPNLKAIFSLGAGIDGFLIDPEFPKHIPLVRFVDETLSREMAQYIVMHVLIQHRAERHFAAAQREAKWRQAMLERPTEKTRIGILGIGEIGTVAAERLRDLGFPVSGWSRTKKSVPGVRGFAGAGELDAFLAQSDFLVCVLPLTPQTRHILNAQLFAKLPKGAYVINVARGGHVNEPELIAALDSGQLSGATLDVFETEPLPASSPIWRHPKIIATPHVAAITSPVAAARSVIDGIAAMERGERPAHIVDMERGY